MANKRWTCPICGSGKLAPSRPRRDDTRRYCLSCSEKTGRLVQRECAALERQRGVAKERAVRKRQAAQERSKAREKAKDPFDMKGWFKRLQRLDTFNVKREYRDRRKTEGGWALTTKLESRWKRVELELRGGRGGGRAYGGYRILLNVGGGRPCNQLSTLIHEMAHIVNHWRGGRGHDDGWRSIFGAAIQDLTGETMKASPHRYGDNADAVIQRWLEQEEHPAATQRVERKIVRNRPQMSPAERIARANPDKVSRWDSWRSEGMPRYELVLKPGWQYEDCHTIVEYTASELRKAFEDVKPCDCEHCKDIA
jgi:hypothetical protein